VRRERGSEEINDEDSVAAIVKDCVGRRRIEANC
jgi:hypothetical protein